jgi:hypothetical protein
MQPDRWGKIKELYQGALVLPPEKRKPSLQGAGRHY